MVQGGAASSYRKQTTGNNMQELSQESMNTFKQPKSNLDCDTALIRAQIKSEVVDGEMCCFDELITGSSPKQAST